MINNVVDIRTVESGAVESRTCGDQSRTERTAAFPFHDQSRVQRGAASYELGRWTLESGVEVSTSTGFFTGIAEIDETSVALSDTLARVMGALEYLPQMSPAMYGTAVHIAFGLALRLQGLPGVGDIERSFSLDTVDPYYGLAGTIRTDATLRNVQGDIIAIYDVKTGAQTISRARADELRAKTRAAPDTPVFELNVVRGISRKQIVLSILRSRSRARPMTRGI
ncbi:hypothetical protein ACJMQP_23310 [Rhodopseudomonas palustris]